MTTPKVDDIWLTRKQAAHYLKRSVRWLDRHPPDKGGPARVEMPGALGFWKSDLDDYLERCRRPTSVAERRSPSLSDRPLSLG